MMEQEEKRGKKMYCKKNREKHKLSENNLSTRMKQMQSCRNVPCKPPSPQALSLSLHKQPQSLLILNLLFLKERGQQGLL